MACDLERQIIELVAADRLDVPISSMSGKLKRMKPKLAKDIEIDEFFEGSRAYARIEEDNRMKARGMKEGIEVFGTEYPRHGKILKDYIEEQREMREKHIYFGMKQGCKLTADDYLGIMNELGFSEGMAKGLYPELMEVSRKLSKARDEERSVLIG